MGKVDAIGGEVTRLVEVSWGDGGGGVGGRGDGL